MGSNNRDIKDVLSEISTSPTHPYKIRVVEAEKKAFLDDAAYRKNWTNYHRGRILDAVYRPTTAAEEEEYDKAHSTGAFIYSRYYNHTIPLCRDGAYPDDYSLIYVFGAEIIPIVIREGDHQGTLLIYLFKCLHTLKASKMEKKQSEDRPEESKESKDAPKRNPEITHVKMALLLTEYLFEDMLEPKNIEKAQMMRNYQITKCASEHEWR